MAETAAGKSRARSKAKPKGDPEAEPQGDAGVDDASGADQDEAQDEPAGVSDEPTGEQAAQAELPPAPPDTEPALPPEQGAGDAPSEDDAPLSLAVLLRHAEGLLSEYDSVMVRGVLADAPDPISVADARTRIERFLHSPVIPTTEEA